MSKPNPQKFIESFFSRPEIKKEVKVLDYWSDPEGFKVTVVAEDLKTGRIMITTYVWQWDRRYKRNPVGKYSVFESIYLTKSELKRICQCL